LIIHHTFTQSIHTQVTNKYLQTTINKTKRMSEESALSSLQQTHESILRIKQYLDPFLAILTNYHKYNKSTNTKKEQSQSNATTVVDPNNNNNNSSSKKKKQMDIQSSYNNMMEDYYKIIEAEAAVALAIGTLRFMALRLKGQERGKKKNDPLRMELSKMKEMLSQVRALKREDENENEDEDEDENETKSITTVSEGASERNIINRNDTGLSQNHHGNRSSTYSSSGSSSSSQSESKSKRKRKVDQENEHDSKATVSNKANMKDRVGVKKQRNK